MPICRRPESVNLSCELEIAKGASTDDVPNCRTNPTKLGCLPPLPSSRWVQNARQTGLTCDAPDQLSLPAYERFCGYCRSSFSPPAPSREDMVRADGSKSEPMGGAGRCA